MKLELEFTYVATLKPPVEIGPRPARNAKLLRSHRRDGRRQTAER